MLLASMPIQVLHISFATLRELESTKKFIIRIYALVMSNRFSELLTMPLSFLPTSVISAFRRMIVYPASNP